MASFKDQAHRFFVEEGFPPNTSRKSISRQKDWIDSGVWLNVATGQSSYVDGIRYDKELNHLVVRFLKGGRCTYYGDSVNQNLAKAMARAPSLGRFVHEKLWWIPYLEKHGR